MAVLVIDEVTFADDVLNLARHLLDALANGDIGQLTAPGTVNLTNDPHQIPARPIHDIVNFDDDYTCDRPNHRDGCSCREDAAQTEPRQLVTLESARHEGPAVYTTCAQVGTHLGLTHCWMCWSDVFRGALTVEDALMVA